MVLCVGINVVGLLAQDGGVLFGSDHFQAGGYGSGAQHVILADYDIFEALLLPLFGDVLRDFVVGFGASRMRHGSEVTMVVANAVAGDGGLELRFELDFRGGMSRAEARDESGRIRLG